MHRGQAVKGLMTVGCIFVLFTYVAYAKDATAATIDNFPDDFFWRIIGGLCTVGVLVMNYQIVRRDKQSDKRDEFLNEISSAIYGSKENQDGLLTRMSVMENIIERCPGCDSHKHSREADPTPHLHRRKTDQHEG